MVQVKKQEKNKEIKLRQETSSGEIWRTFPLYEDSQIFSFDSDVAEDFTAGPHDEEPDMCDDDSKTTHDQVLNSRCKVQKHLQKALKLLASESMVTLRVESKISLQESEQVLRTSAHSKQRSDFVMDQRLSDMK